jgi:hypothetical protein
MDNDKEKQKGAILACAIKSLKDNFLIQSEIIDHKALVCKTKYDAAINKGFTEAQALELCTKEWEL